MTRAGGLATVFALGATIIVAPAPALAVTGSVRPTRVTGASTARIVAPAEVRARPGGGRVVWRAATVTSWSGHAQTLLVLASRRRGGRRWLEVLLPIRPNGTSGWIPSDRAQLDHTPYWIRLRLRSRRLTIFRDGERLRRFRAVIGAPGTPTPRGLAAIYERNAQPEPHGFLGPWALSLTALSRVLESFGGGPGRVAIHGRDGASLRDPLGSARSHGCIRITSRAVSWLARRARPGTPVLIRR